MTMTAAEAWAARIDALYALIDQVYVPLEEIAPEEMGAFFSDHPLLRLDPRRELDSELTAVASYLRPEDVLVDVGGGSGRVGLPMALRCREVIHVDPSDPQFFVEASAARAGISNVASVQAEWMQAEGVEGDVCLAANVLDLVRDVVPFIENLEAAARRRVIIVGLATIPFLGMWRLLAGLHDETGPDYSSLGLLPVLWEMGMLPDVSVLPFQPPADVWGFPAQPLPGLMPPRSREEAVERVLGFSYFGRLRDPEHARPLIEARFDDFFVRVRDGFILGQPWTQRYILITWEKGQRLTEANGGTSTLSATGG